MKYLNKIFIFRLFELHFQFRIEMLLTGMSNVDFVSDSVLWIINSLFIFSVSWDSICIFCVSVLSWVGVFGNSIIPSRDVDDLPCQKILIFINDWIILNNLLYIYKWFLLLISSWLVKSFLLICIDSDSSVVSVTINLGEVDAFDKFESLTSDKLKQN